MAEMIKQFLHIKDEPMAFLVLCALMLYKIISETASFIQHKYFEKPDKLSQILSKDISILKIYSGDLPIEDKLESLFDYLHAGYNGEVLKYGYHNLILPNKEKWDKTYRRKMEKQPDFDPKKNFEQAMAQINQSLI